LRSNRSNSHRAKFARAEDRWHDEELRDDPPRRSWRRRLTVLTLIAIGAYAYRMYYVAPGSTQTPADVTAEEAPSRVIPVVTNPQSGKLIQDRVGVLRSGDGRMSREEQPVESRSTGSTTGWAWPAPAAPSQPPPQGAASAPDNTSGNPKRVATLTIRPDGTEASSRRVSPPPSASTSAAPAQARPAQAKPAQRAAAPAVPLSLDPPAPADDGERALTPPAPRMAAMPSPTATAKAAAGGYFVQMSSQRSEADAQASLRSLQEKFPSELGDRTAIIRRADLGAKGIYYRALTGPFASADEADQFCRSLKAAGGACIIQRN
jgi:hypothetical protein